MSVAETIFKSELATGFVYPFFLIFFITFAILEKTKVLGNNKQLDALISAVIGFIFITAVSPKLIVGDLILFLTVGLVVVFVALLLWGFVMGGETSTLLGNDKIKYVIGAIITIVVIIVLMVSAGVDFGIFERIFDFIFMSNWSADLWTNLIFIAAIAGAIAWAVKGVVVKS